MKAIKTKSLEISFIDSKTIELKYMDDVDIDKTMSAENYSAYDALVGDMDGIKRLIVLGMKDVFIKEVLLVRFVDLLFSQLMQLLKV